MAEINIIKFFHAYHGSKPHEHNFKIEFCFEGMLNGDFVDSIDFHEIMPTIENILKALEGKYLPEMKEMGRATCERIAFYLFKKLNHQNLT